MKLLFDQNLSHKLPQRLADLFPQSEHVRTAGLDCMPDQRIWEYAKASGFTIVTQDADFVEWSRLFGSPPKVIWLHCGNTTPKHIEQLLRANAEVIAQLEHDPVVQCVELL